MASGKNRCPHGLLKGRCWECLTPDEQNRNREVWKRLETEIPDLATRRNESKHDLEAGNVIKIGRSGHEDVVLPHTVLREIVDTIQSDKERRSDG